jgi:hypothetical protein
MGKRNIRRLKEKVGFEPEAEGVDIYFELIDRIYYQNQGHTEDFKEDTEITTWFFEDGRRISFDITEVTHLALFLMHLYNDMDEQLMTVEELEKSYFLEENKWKTSK